MNPVSGEKPPTVSSSTSHALRSDSSTILVALALAAAASAGDSMRLTREPPCGVCRAVASAATALGWGVGCGERV